MCNVFKPERCHHCSACNRCVLNMDHHCPWINNCVGFWNRKYFMLLLVYVLIITYTTFFTLGYDFYAALKWGFNYRFIDRNDKRLKKNCIIMLSFIFNGIICVLMTAFLKFHIKLARENKTTIENLDNIELIQKRGHKKVRKEIIFYLVKLRIKGTHFILMDNHVFQHFAEARNVNILMMPIEIC